jgi:hypothetical protein
MFQDTRDIVGHVLGHPQYLADMFREEDMFWDTQNINE